MNQVVIRILDNTNNVLGDLDLKDFNDFPLAINKGIVNLDNLKERTGTYTKTFKVPNTKNNSNLLNSVDDINSRKDYKDALNRKSCVILVNGAEIEKGFVQVTKVYNGFQLDNFELVFFGNNIDWVKDSSELELQDIVFRNNSQVYDNAGISVANLANSNTYDHAYPFVSRSGDKSYKPVYYLRSLIERGLNQKGWNVSSDFLQNNSVIKRLVCDFDLKFIVRDNIIQASKSIAELTNNINVSEGDSQRVIFNDDSTLPNQDDNGNFNTTTGVYTVPQNGNYLVGAAPLIVNRQGTIEVSYKQKIYKNATSVLNPEDGVILKEQTLTVPFNEPGFSYDFGGEFSLQQGDTISIYVEAVRGPFIITNESRIEVYRKQKIELGDQFFLNEMIPVKIKLIDVINDFTRLFNIYYWTDIKSKTIYFEPRDDFFLTDYEDWSNKLDLNNRYEIDYISSYKRDIEFKYRDLGGDRWLKGWNDVNKRTYGTFNYNLPNRFAEGKDVISLGLFSAGYTQRDDNANVDNNNNFNSNKSPISLRLWSEYAVDKPDGEIRDYNPKIYLFNYGTQTSIFGDARQVSYLGNDSTTFPYGIFESYQGLDSDINLSFTNGLKADGSEDAGLFQTYYSSMFKNIEEGGRLIAYFDLDSTDIENLDFRKLVYISYPEEVKGNYFIESVIDYNPIKNSLTKVRLFKYENLGSVTVDNTQEGNNDADTDNGNNPTELENIFVESTILGIDILLPVVSENPKNGKIRNVVK